MIFISDIEHLIRDDDIKTMEDILNRSIINTVRSEGGRTPLIYAVFNNNLSMVTLFNDHGVDVSLYTDISFTIECFIYFRYLPIDR